MKRRPRWTEITVWVSSARGCLFGEVKLKKDSRTEAFIPQTRLAAFAQGLQSLGWIIGQNVRIDYRWGDGRIERASRCSRRVPTVA
jgi:hypothetical protein